MHAQHAVGHVMERAAPQATDRLADQSVRALKHFARSLVGEGQQQHAARIDPLLHQPRNAVGQRAGLAGSGRGDNQHRTIGRLHGT